MNRVAVPVRQQLVSVTERLVTDYAGRVDDATIRQMVNEVYANLESARVQQFVPVLVDRQVRRQLRLR